MRWSDFAAIDELGFTSYEKKALVSIGILGVADAAALCREGRIPTSKIYSAMEKLAALRLVDCQRSRPRLYIALPADAVAGRLVELAQARARAFAESGALLREALAALPGRIRGRKVYVDIALGTEAHVKRHLVRLAGARTRIASYLEAIDLAAIDESTASGFPILRRIGRNAAQRGLVHRAVFGFTHRTAPRLLQFLREHGGDLAHLSGVRYSGEVGHPFHLVDDDTVILALDHPFVPGGRVASILIQDPELARSLAQGFDGLWDQAMRDLREIRFHPHRSSDGA